MVVAEHVEIPVVEDVPETKQINVVHLVVVVVVETHVRQLVAETHVPDLVPVTALVHVVGNVTPVVPESVKDVLVVPAIVLELVEHIVVVLALAIVPLLVRPQDRTKNIVIALTKLREVNYG